MTTVVDDEDIKTEMKKVIRQFSVFYITLNAARTNDDRPIVGIISKTDKAHRNVTHADKLRLFPLTPEIGQRPHSKSGKRIFSCFPVILLLKHRVFGLVYQVKSFFASCLTQHSGSSVLWHKNRQPGSFA
ncbi:Uncharacterised protein [Salmonella enterica subsp. enterica]|uniref:Uncharacterized protein n=1 Tax=Salmonella enterica I TaxID=59201 RepID=A0A379WI68_SALET|nr:Uncharacterised protein [Salmonella enterica subsp. enterica]